MRPTRHWRVHTARTSTVPKVEVFTRGVQANVGMGFGVLAFSVAMGALFAVVFAWPTAASATSRRGCCR